MDVSQITFVVLTKNEAARIGDCLASLPSGAKALVYDSASADGTPALASARGARVVDGQWRGFAQTRLDAAALVDTLWTFMLDADERVTPELALEIARADPPDDVVAYSVPRRNYFCGAWIRGAGWWPDRLIRLFRTGRVGIQARHSGDAALHETWTVRGASARLDAPLDHHSYDDLARYRAKFDRYTSIEASASEPDALSLAGLAMLAPLRALWLLFVRGAIADGWRGAYIAWFSALYPVAVAAKALRRGASPPA
ncbi:MAG TPA: glycosyltransferase family 2 protein [Candidatus Eremiobacteraceae bacterium]|nr:glycosyltransferase family 2 protein [Candidatus Eremiobacteraceae bacterium]